MNQKYDNVTAMLASGRLNWVSDPVIAVLLDGGTFAATDTRLSEVGGTQVTRAAVSGRMVSPEGNLLGWPVSFPGVSKDTDFQVVLAKEDPQDPYLIAYYDEDDDAGPLNLKYNGTLILRPILLAGAEPPILGMWVRLT
jgi:hypothetical protein